MRNKILIVGSGISGIISALTLAEKGYGKDVIMIEKNTAPGGLLRKFDYGEFGIFDYGMHNFLETGISELDKLIFQLLPEHEWQILEGKNRDLAGLFFNGVLQRNTPYFDLRSLSREDYKESLVSFFEHVNSGVAASEFESAEEYAIKRFGKHVALNTVIPSVEKIHKKPATELDAMAAYFTPMSRITFGDEPLVSELTCSEKLRNLIAWSDQRTLPLERSSGRRGYYPAAYGVYRIIEAAISVLVAKGVTVLTETEIVSVNEKNGKITDAEINSAKGRVIFENPQLIIWSGGIPLLGRFLKTDMSGLKNDKPLKTIIVNILLDKKPEMDDLYYFFCYDKNFHTYRLTNYITYSKGAVRNNLYPICIELLVDEEKLKSGFSAEETAVDELKRFGIMQNGTTIKFVKAEILDAGFPMPSLNNIRGIKKIRNDIQLKKIDNLIMSGILAENNLFFQTDVLIDTYNKIKTFISTHE